MKEDLNLSVLEQEIRDSLTGMTCFPLATELKLKNLPVSSVTVESLPKSKVMTSLDKLQTCDNSFQVQKSFKTLAQDLTSRKKDLKPYWNDVCKEISSLLLSPTEIDSAGSVLNSSSSLLTQMVEKSWFSTSLKHHPSLNSPKIYSQYSMSSPVECMDLDAIFLRSRKIRLYPTKEQLILFKQWLGVSRKFYNESIEHYNASEAKLHWMKLATELLHVHMEDYIKEVPYQIKRSSIAEAFNSWISNCKKVKKLGTSFRLRFRSKHDSVQSCYIPKSAVKKQGIYYRVIGKLRYAEHITLDNIKDCRLVLENNRWFLAVPTEIDNQVTENQSNLVSIDPGIRSFSTFFSTDGYFGQLGLHDFKKIYRLVYNIDKLISKRDSSKDKLKKSSYVRAIKNLRFRVKNLVDELHNKVALFFVKNFQVIIYPLFRTKEMAIKANRKLRKKSVRSMLNWSFFKFEQKLVSKCQEYGRKLVRISEAYTSKTNSFTGELMNIGGKEWFKFDNIQVNRDVNGARGILLRALRDTSVCETSVPQNA